MVPRFLIGRFSLYGVHSVQSAFHPVLDSLIVGSYLYKTDSPIFSSGSSYFKNSMHHSIFMRELAKI
jgi:hypothetical protein